MDIALAMIVKNEAAVLRRCLDSVYEHVTEVVIHDTGSSDDTVKVGLEFTDAVMPAEWSSFGENRAEVIRDASITSDYVLLADADFVFHFDDDFEWPELADEAYFIRIREGDIEYDYAALLRADREWNYIGRTHECLAGLPTDIKRIDGVWIEHRADGGCRAEKFERDLELLERDLIDDSVNTRAWFYFAQTLKCLGRNEEAADAYLVRAEMGGWDEEVYCSLLEAGILRNSVSLLLRAWSIRPTRLEALYEAIWRLRIARAHHAIRALLMGAQSTGPWSDGLDDKLFVRRWVWDYALGFEAWLNSVQMGAEDVEIRDHLLHDVDNLPEAYRRAMSFAMEESADSE